MRRKTFDTMMSSAGLVIAMVLLVAGGLMTWGYNFANGQVTEQLTQQNIFFPPAGSEALAPANIGPFLNQYAGQQLTTGEQAEAYANHFIAVHMFAATDGKTYAEVSNLARANPDDATLAAQVNTAFRGETLRGLLLTSYAFWKIGELAKIGAIAAFAAAGLMFMLAMLGFYHARKVSPEDEILAPVRVARRAS